MSVLPWNSNFSWRYYVTDTEQIIPIIVKEPPAQQIAAEGENVVITVIFRIYGQLSNYNWFWIKNSSRFLLSNDDNTFTRTTLNYRNETTTNGSKEFTSQLILKSSSHSITGYYYFEITNRYGKFISSRKTKVIFAGTFT